MNNNLNLTYVIGSLKIMVKKIFKNVLPIQDFTINSKHTPTLSYGLTINQYTSQQPISKIKKKKMQRFSDLVSLKM